MNYKNLILAQLLAISVSLVACAQRRVVATSTTVVRTVPAATVVVHRGVRYRYVNGVYYRPYAGGYTIVRPPVGVRVSVLPAGFVTANFGGIPYYFAGGVYYIQSGPKVYEVVEKPAGLIVPAAATTTVIAQLPAGYKAVTINGKRYFISGDTYYERIVAGNGDITYKVAGKRE